jgi:hypothetical protein
MQAIPLNISKPLMSLDIFGIVRIDIATSTILVLMRGRGLAVRFVPFGAKTVVLFLNNTSYKVLASFTHQRFMWKAESSLVVLLLG